VVLLVVNMEARRCGTPCGKYGSKEMCYSLWYTLEEVGGREEVEVGSGLSNSLTVSPLEKRRSGRNCPKWTQ